jgi:DNA-directed RNA polymerase specialized sigma24 family protein
MDAHPPTPEWVLPATGDAAGEDQKLMESARMVWPSILAYARRQYSEEIPFHDRDSLAAEIWEDVLRSVSRTRQRMRGRGDPILNLEAYLFGVFQHRLRRALKRERQRNRVVRSFPPLALIRLPGMASLKWKHWFDRELQIRQLVARMDEWTREVWTRRQYGYSWREIAQSYGLNEGQTKMRFRYAIQKIRKEIAGAQPKKDKRGES